MVFLRVRSLIILSPLLMGCWLPFADPELSLSLALESKLKLIFTRTIEIHQENLDFDSEFYFLPENNPNPQFGFFIIEENSQFLPILITPLDTLTLNPTYSFPPGQQVRPTMFPTHNSKTYLLINRLDNGLHKLSILEQNLFSPFNSEFAVANLTLTTSPPYIASGTTPFFENLDLKFVTYLAKNNTLAKFQVKDGNAYNIADTNNPNYKTIPNSENLDQFQLGGTIHRLAGTSEIILGSFKESEETYINRVYDLTGTVALRIKEFNFKHRVEATLNNGQLILVRNGSFYEVYNLSEERRARFPAGPIAFCFERRRDDGEWVSVFSRSLLRKENNKYKVLLNAYEYPSDKLGDLGN